jgi:hypothetical protein
MTYCCRCDRGGTGYIFGPTPKPRPAACVPLADRFSAGADQARFAVMTLWKTSWATEVPRVRPAVSSNQKWMPR